MPSPLFPSLCPGCFADKGDSVPSICPRCGYDESAPRSALILPHRTVLNNQYLIGCTLGKLGGFGITYLAWDIHLETPVAIKEYLPRELAGRDSNHLTIRTHSHDDHALFMIGLELFLKEARTLAKFDHENIVRVRNVLEENDTAYLVMNFYEGKTLAAYLEEKGGRLPEKIALAIMLPLLDGLREVHAKGFLHRDIKPQNIYLTKTGTPILLDFGSARMVMGERTRSMTVLMTPGYAPFEQYHRKGQQGPWTDIYACGATLYHILTGTIPLESTARAESDFLQAPATLLAEISPSVSAVVMQAMAMNRDARPATVIEFIDALEQAKTSGSSAHEKKRAEAKAPATILLDTQPEEQAPTLSPYFRAALGKGNVAYYLSRFTKFNLGWGELLTPSWNTSAFIFNALWLLYRRVFGLGVLFFLLPLVLLMFTNNRWIGFGSWLVISIVLGCYGNAIYFMTLSQRIATMEEQFPGNRLHPLKMSRLASAGEANLQVPLVYSLVALLIIYAYPQFSIWPTTKFDNPAYSTAKPLIRTPPKPELQTSSDDLTSEAAESTPFYNAAQFKENANELLKRADWSGLLELAQKWCGLDRLNPDAWMNFGIANFKLARYSLAQPAFETYFRLKPEDNDYVMGYLAKSYIKLKKRAAAESALIKTIALRSNYNRPVSSDDAFYYYELGNIYALSTEKKQAALRLYELALKIEPDNELFKANANNTLRELKQQPDHAPSQQDNAESLDSTAMETSNPTPSNKSRSYGSLSAAAAAGDIQAAQLMLGKGADVNQSEMGSYPLIQAARHKQSEMVAFLLKHGANIKAEDKNGLKAIVYSITNADKTTMDLLTNAGALHGYP